MWLVVTGLSRSRVALSDRLLHWIGQRSGMHWRLPKPNKVTLPVDETALRQWADRHACRRHLPILVRGLMRETTESLVSMRFPGHDAVGLPGLNGQVEREAGTFWVPEGRSVWEMGCHVDPRSKAAGDYRVLQRQNPSQPLVH